MTPSYTLSPSTISPEGHGLHNSHFYLHRNCSSFFSNESSLLVKETLPFKPHEKRSTKSFLPILRLKNSELTHPFASVSSFAEAGGEEDRNEGIQIRKHQETVESKEDDSHGMARAFDISSGTASAISILIAFAALSANDVANAMGTSVGSGALTLRQAVLTAAILEFSGALLMGTHVTSTMQKGILVANVFQGRDTLLFAGLLSSLAAAGCIILWLACLYHSLYNRIHGWIWSCLWGAWCCLLEFSGKGDFIVGDLAIDGSNGVVSRVQIHPQVRVQRSKSRTSCGCSRANCCLFGCNWNLFRSFSSKRDLSFGSSTGFSGAAGALLVDRIIRKQLGHLLVKASSTQPEPKENATHSKISAFSDFAGPKGTQLEIVYGVFGYMQILSACFMSFAHGGNDVSNAIGPLAAALSILHGGASGTDIVIPLDVLAWGGFGIVAGLMVWGYRVIATIGKKITELTPTRGFAAEFAAASVVLVASKLGLPISATHTLVGAVMGVGFARGLNNVRVETVREIVVSWAVTIPVGAIFAVLYTWIFTKLLSYIL
uniref:Phosphate transporter n=1 Tax=Salix viminalis TaxID=40686 RepID=A0A6N2L7G5_SALVM